MRQQRQRDESGRAHYRGHGRQAVGGPKHQQPGMEGARDEADCRCGDEQVLAPACGEHEEDDGVEDHFYAERPVYAVEPRAKRPEKDRMQVLVKQARAPAAYQHDGEQRYGGSGEGRWVEADRPRPSKIAGARVLRGIQNDEAGDDEEDFDPDPACRGHRRQLVKVRTAVGGEDGCRWTPFHGPSAVAEVVEHHDAGREEPRKI